MGIFDKIRYTKALLVILPLGLVFLYLGIDYLSNSASSTEDLEKIEGVVNRIDSEAVYIDQCSCYLETLFIEFEKDSKEYFNREIVKVKFLKENIFIGDTIILGYDRYLQIQYLNHDNKLLIKYERSNIYSYVFIVVGILLILFSIYYLLTQKKDLE